MYFASWKLFSDCVRNLLACQNMETRIEYAYSKMQCIEEKIKIVSNKKERLVEKRQDPSSYFVVTQSQPRLQILMTSQWLY